MEFLEILEFLELYGNRIYDVYYRRSFADKLLSIVPRSAFAPNDIRIEIKEIKKNLFFHSFPFTIFPLK